MFKEIITEEVYEAGMVNTHVRTQLKEWVEVLITIVALLAIGIILIYI